MTYVTEVSHYFEGLISITTFVGKICFRVGVAIRFGPVKLAQIDPVQSGLFENIRTEDWIGYSPVLIRSGFDPVQSQFGLDFTLRLWDLSGLKP
ncbi:unnamed protein product [Linum trigynum]|uniref:Uncharacterized protein n=1 Tax=Linum trigynum TaxID=586398 RepID=A0AAV2EAF0_9ROSI